MKRAVEKGSKAMPMFGENTRLGCDEAKYLIAGNAEPLSLICDVDNGFESLIRTLDMTAGWLREHDDTNVKGVGAVIFGIVDQLEMMHGMIGAASYRMLIDKAEVQS